MRAEKLRAVDALTTIAGDHGLTIVQLALAFVLDDPAVTAAIIGPRTLDQLRAARRRRPRPAPRCPRRHRRRRHPRPQHQPLRRRLTLRPTLCVTGQRPRGLVR